MSIKNNTTNLQSLLEQVNNLPNAGSGGSEDITVETSAYTTELSELGEQISALESALEGKGVGGGSGSGASLETCTVTIQSAEACYVGATILSDDGIIQTFNTPLDKPVKSLTLSNVICGSLITCLRIGDMIVTPSYDKCSLALGMNGDFLFSITASAGETATINISALDF